MIVYHGSDHIITEPLYLGGKADNDYGNGFYTTEYEERAKSWAALNGNPERSIVNVYELDTENLMVMDLNEYGVIAWIAEVVKNRGTSQEVERLFYKGSLGNQIFLKSEKAFGQIKWINSYEVQLCEEDKKADIYARREVNKFLSKRMEAILIDGYEVPGITARFAIQNHLIYCKEFGGYENAGI